MRKVKIGFALGFGAMAGAGFGLATLDATGAMAFAAVVTLIHMATQEKRNG